MRNGILYVLAYTCSLILSITLTPTHSLKEILLETLAHLSSLIHAVCLRKFIQAKKRVRLKLSSAYDGDTCTVLPCHVNVSDCMPK